VTSTEKTQRRRFRGETKGDVSDVLDTLAAQPGLDAAKLSIAARMARYGEDIRRKRLMRGWSQAELADAAGLTQTNISLIEAGTLKNGPTFRTMAQLSDVLDAGLEMDAVAYVEPAALAAGRTVVAQMVEAVVAGLHSTPRPDQVMTLRQTAAGGWEAVPVPMTSLGAGPFLDLVPVVKAPAWQGSATKPVLSVTLQHGAVDTAKGWFSSEGS
jgi:transcriptional regulator with XRE-family HTH domain